MKTLTVSSLLSMEKSIRSRLTQLVALKSECSKRTVWHSPEKIEEPTYDIKLVDKKITKLNKALFNIDQKIKESNALTKVEIEIDYDDLVSDLDSNI